MVSRQQRKKAAKKKLSIIVVAILIMGLALSTCSLYYYNYAVPASSGEKNASGLNSYAFWPRWRDVMFAGVPFLQNTVEKEPTVKVTPEISAAQVLQRAVQLLANIDIRDIRSFVRAEIPLLSLVKSGVPTVSAATLPNFPKFDTRAILSGGKPLVGIYHTHTAESFVPSAGVSHRPGGQLGEIVEVGAAMVKRLEKHGIAAVQSKNIHDFPSFMKAYAPAEATAKKMLADNPSLQMIFDIHRDADKRENATAVIDGAAAARVTIVVAKGQPDLIQPHWQQNHAFAKLIDAKLNQRYPGLSRGIQVVDWRYNQHLHPRALLLEIGCQENSKEEAMRGAEMIADVLAEILAENQ